MTNTKEKHQTAIAADIAKKPKKAAPRKPLDKSRKDWWKQAVIYQIYPKSFQDSNGDGIGDLPGILSRLDYLEDLGVDALWLSPIFCSPQADNGYDVSDYEDVDPMFGSMADLETLIAEAKKRGISIILDLVLNHTSEKHPWFLEALKSKDSPYHDYYLFRDGTPENPPTDMKAIFGGSAWEYVPELGQYYYHQFAKEQPDLNWSNPKVREELYAMIRFWVNKGVDGFRLDAIDLIGKDVDLKTTSNGPNLHPYLQELSKNALIKDGLVTVGEAWGASVEDARRYSKPDGSELSMIFQFRQNFADLKDGKWERKELDLPALKQVFEDFQCGLHGCGWNALFMDNHDLPRIVSRWGDPEHYWKESAKMLVIWLYGMEGTPFVYQGEEIGMTNVRFAIEDYRDIEILNHLRDGLDAGRSEEELMEGIYNMGRDNARTPMQWSNAKNAGFSEAEPWIKLNPNCKTINAASQQNDPDSIFHTYKELIALRKSLPVLANGDFQLLDKAHPAVFAYTRKTDDQALLTLANFSKEPQTFDIPAAFAEADCLISSYGKDSRPELLKGENLEGLCTIRLRPYEGCMLLETKLI